MSSRAGLGAEDSPVGDYLYEAVCLDTPFGGDHRSPGNPVVGRQLCDWRQALARLGQDVVTEMAADAAHAQLEAEQNRSPRKQLAARRASARHDELREAGTSGLWQVTCSPAP